MAAARPHIAIARMNENWGASDEGSFYKELEMEKKRWMLSALDKINKEARSANASEEPRQSDDPTGDQLLLSLFETQGKPVLPSLRNPYADINPSYRFVFGGGSSHSNNHSHRPAPTVRRSLPKRLRFALTRHRFNLVTSQLVQPGPMPLPPFASSEQ